MGEASDNKTFKVERSIAIAAPPDRIFEAIADFHRWTDWSPWEGLDPNLQRTYSGAEEGVGAIYEWAGTRKVGKGRMEITETSAPTQRERPDQLHQAVQVAEPGDVHADAGRRRDERHVVDGRTRRRSRPRSWGSSRAWTSSSAATSRRVSPSSRPARRHESGLPAPVTDRPDVAPEIVAALRSVCTALPEAYEEQAWVGTRWRVRKKTFAHVLFIDSGWPPAYVRAAGSDGPMTVLTFRSSGPELEALRDAGHPFFKPVWWTDIVGMVLEPDVDWAEVAELVTESYCALAPKKLVALVDRPG